jgi:hypothetical protein
MERMMVTIATTPATTRTKMPLPSIRLAIATMAFIYYQSIILCRMSFEN